MTKSFGYDPRTGYWVARNEVGDFGLHMGLIRSFAWGNNFPPQSPFFPGTPLPYHFVTDGITGLLERASVRMDIAYNLLSALAFTGILFSLYRISQQLFEKNFLVSILSVLLFVFHGGLTIWDFLVLAWKKGNVLTTLWGLPDYIHKGPFDGSTISILFTLNVFLNQRHLILGMFCQLLVLSIVLSRVLVYKKTPVWIPIVLGAFLALSSRVHFLLFVSTMVTLCVFFLLTKSYRWIIWMVGTASILVLPLAQVMIASHHVLTHPYIALGFFSGTPFRFSSWLWYWWENMGLALFLIPLGFVWSKRRAQVVFLSLLPLFLIPNILQLSFRLEHNHSILNYFFALAGMYSAYALVRLGKKGIMGMAFACVLFFGSTASGVVDLMAIKNDFRYPVLQGIDSRLIVWIRDNTTASAIMLAPQRLYDPVVLAGRRTYVGHSYYVTVMGYPYDTRLGEYQEFLAHPTSKLTQVLEQKGIGYVLLPKHPDADFLYPVDTAYFERTHKKVFDGANDTIYAL